MADVTGHLGDQPVELNNAATEATLKALLTIAKVDSKNLYELAKKALGPNAGSLKEFEKAIEEGSQGFKKLNQQTTESIDKQAKLNQSKEDLRDGFKSLKGTLDTLSGGNATMSSVLKNFEQLPGGVGLVAQGFNMLASFQQTNLEALQKMSSSGVTFAGSLTDLRVASAKTFLTLDQFTNVVKTNADVFSSLGGDAQAGVDRFVKIQNTLLAPGSVTQKNLASLGVSAEEAANLTASYMRQQGTMNKRDLEDSQKVSESVAQYAQELNGLAAITGKSREEIQKKAEAELSEAQFQQKLAGMDKETAAKTSATYKEVLATQGQGAADYFKSMVMGLPPMTEAARIYASTMSAGVKSQNEYFAVTQDKTIGEKEAAAKRREILATQIADSRGNTDAMKTVLNASALSGTGIAKNYVEITKMQTKFQNMTAAQIKEQLDNEALKNENTESQASEIDEANKKMQAFGAAILKAIAPIVDFLTPAIKHFGTAIIAVTALMMAMKAKSLVSGMLGGAGSVAGAAGGVPGKALGGIGAGTGGILEGLAKGIGAFTPNVLIGAGVLAASIVIIGASVAAATWMLGKALPTFAEGIKSFGDIDGDNLIDVATGIGALGLAMAGFGIAMLAGSAGNTFSQMLGGVTKLFGGNDLLGTITSTLKILGPEIDNLTKLGDGLQNLGNGMMAYGKAVASIDIAKATQVKELLKGPSAAEQVANAGAKLFSTAADKISTAVTSSNNQEKTGSDLQALNSTMREMLKYMKDATANTERTYKVIENNGKVW